MDGNDHQAASNDGSLDYEHQGSGAAAAPGPAEEAARPTEGTSGPVSVPVHPGASRGALRQPLRAAGGWLAPDVWIEHQLAHSAALAAVEDALNADAQPGAIELLERAQVVLDHALHAELSRAAEAADVLVLTGHLHRVQGCWVARAADPVAVEPGGYRRDRIPRYLTRAEGERWLSSGPRRKRCRRCYPGSR